MGGAAPDGSCQVQEVVSAILASITQTMVSPVPVVVLVLVGTRASQSAGARCTVTLLRHTQGTATGWLFNPETMESTVHSKVNAPPPTHLLTRGDSSKPPRSGGACTITPPALSRVGAQAMDLAVDVLQRLLPYNLPGVTCDVSYEAFRRRKCAIMIQDDLEFSVRCALGRSWHVHAATRMSHTACVCLGVWAAAV